jgi:hypothetical protein
MFYRRRKGDKKCDVLFMNTSKKVKKLLAECGQGKQELGTFLSMNELIEFGD